MMQSFKALFLTIIVCGMLSGCVYKIDVQQGNVITQKQVKALHPGMTQAQVKKLFGEPLLHNIYKGNQLIYVYTMKHRSQNMSRRNLTIYFRSGKVTHFVTDHTRG